LKFVHFESLSQIVEMADSFPCYLGSMQVYCFWFASKPNAELWIFAKSRGNSDELRFCVILLLNRVFSFEAMDKKLEGKATGP